MPTGERRAVPTGSRGIGTKMIEFLARLSPISADTFFLSVLSGLVIFIAIPIAVTFYVKHQRRRRRKLVNSPRRSSLPATKRANELAITNDRGVAPNRRPAEGWSASARNAASQCGGMVPETGRLSRSRRYFSSAEFSRAVRAPCLGAAAGADDAAFPASAPGAPGFRPRAFQRERLLADGPLR